MHAGPSAQQLIDALRIPTLPESVTRVRELLLRDGVGVNEVAEAIATDPPLSALVLRIANSAQIGANEPKISIQAATAVIGLRGVASAVLRAGVLRAYEHVKDAPGFSVKRLWKHSNLVGSVSQHLAKSCRNRSVDFMPRDYYTCGLLHDIGQVVLFDNFGDDYARLFKKGVSSASRLRVETEELHGLDHARIGSLAALRWNLPAPIPDIVKHHHEPMTKPSVAEAACVVACADEIVHLVEAHPRDSAEKLVAKVTVEPQGCREAAIIAAIAHAQDAWSSAKV